MHQPLNDITLKNIFHIISIWIYYCRLFIHTHTHTLPHILIYQKIVCWQTENPCHKRKKFSAFHSMVIKKVQEKCRSKNSPGTGRKRMAKVTIRAWTHRQDDQILPGSWIMAELHDSRPRPVGLLVKIFLGEHHYSTRNKLQNVTCCRSGFSSHNHIYINLRTCETNKKKEGITEPYENRYQCCFPQNTFSKLGTN